MPAMNDVGTNTAHSTRAMAMTGPVTSVMAARAASRGDLPIAMWRSTFSTTTIASSTTMPMASTSPNSDRLLSENPSIAMTARAPTSDTGTAIIGWYTLLTDSFTNTVVSYTMRYSTPAGNRGLSSSILARMALAVSSALD